MLTESQCMLIEKALTEDIEPRKLAAYLCLHMGLTVAEVSALRMGDIHLAENTLIIRSTLTRAKKSEAERYRVVTERCDRTLLMPPQVVKLLKEHWSCQEKCSR